MSDHKRKASPPPANGGSLVKRARANTPPSNQVAISSGADKQKALIRNIPRTSGLESPIVSLAGAHTAEILGCQFDPTGQNIAACSADRSVSLWRTYPPTTNYAHLTTLHKAPILDLRWSLHTPLLYTISADKTLVYTDVTTGVRARKLRAHHGIINSLDRTLAGGAGVELVATGSDDGTVKVWEGGDEGSKHAVATFEVGCPVTSVCWSADGNNVFAGALDNEIHVYDLRKNAQVYTLGGHNDTPTSLALSPSGHYILSGSLSSQTVIHDVRPFSPLPTRVHRVLQGAPAGFENTLLRGAWSKDDGGNRVALGGADRTVCIWEVESGKILYKLPGHKGTVSCVDFHPKEPIILTGSKDTTLLLGELDPGIRV
ncbi:WD40-repeat-containing domain protein [Gautieria morchelliformis]|nr:WD40-repeat-containing domain protein [Gautieria morchelliformis]